MNIVALITLYKPSSQVIENVRKVSEQVSKVYLLDNTESVSIEQSFTGIVNCVYIGNRENLGLSAAFNKVLNTSVIETADYIFFFDQDSSVSEGFIQGIVEEYQLLSQNHKIGALGPVYFDSSKKEYSGVPKKHSEIESDIYPVSELITSGMCTTYKALSDIGFWNENIFLDYADFDLCWRLKQAGYSIFISKKTILYHTLGSGDLYFNFLSKKLHMTFSPPLREYYQTRAAIKLLLKSYVPFRWKKNFIFNLFFRIWIFKAKLPEGEKRLKYFAVGIKDGILRKNGPLNIKK